MYLQFLKAHYSAIGGFWKVMDRSDLRAIELVLRHYPTGTEEDHENPVRLSIVLGEIRLWHQLNIKIKWYRLTNHCSDCALPVCLIAFVCVNYLYDF